jgi:hypothetical protein
LQYPLFGLHGDNLIAETVLLGASGAFRQFHQLLQLLISLPPMLQAIAYNIATVAGET